MNPSTRSPRIYQAVAMCESEAEVHGRLHSCSQGKAYTTHGCAVWHRTSSFQYLPEVMQLPCTVRCPQWCHYLLTACTVSHMLSM